MKSSQPGGPPAPPPSPFLKASQLRVAEHEPLGARRGPAGQDGIRWPVEWHLATPAVLGDLEQGRRPWRGRPSPS